MTREIFDCGFKFTKPSLTSHVKDLAAAFLTLMSENTEEFESNQVFCTLN